MKIGKILTCHYYSKTPYNNLFNDVRGILIHDLNSLLDNSETFNVHINTFKKIKYIRNIFEISIKYNQILSKNVTKDSAFDKRVPVLNQYLLIKMR